jgi:photosystem II stability/assembly factor-like uncharacterized protein
MRGDPRRLWLIAMGLSAAIVAAGQDQGPGFVLQGEGGLVTAFALDPSSPSTIYAATARGLYKTADAGASWRRTGAGLRDHSLLAVAVDPGRPANLYATTDTGGVFRSLDGGEHWIESNTGIAARYVGAIAVDPHHRGGVSAGAEAGRMFRSDDAGESWRELTPPTTHVSVTCIVVDPETPGRLYAGTNSEGVFFSTDAGTTWARPVGRLSRGTVWNLTFGRSGGEMFAGTHDGLFRSADRGASWLPANTGLRSWNVLSIVLDPASAETMYAGTAAAIYKSADRGRSWTELKNDLYVTALAIDPRSPSTLYAATHLGVIKSDDAGTQWKPLRMAPQAEAAASAGFVPDRSGSAGGDASAATSARLPAIPLRARTARRPAALPPLPVRTSPPGP